MQVLSPRLSQVKLTFGVLMSELSVFDISNPVAIKLSKSLAALEKTLQKAMENNLTEMLGVRFLASEYYTGVNHNGRIDTLGIDEDYCPVIIEYKRNSNTNVINQGLFYLDWLLDHKNEFQDVVRKKLGADEAEKVSWLNPRLICIASEYNKYDIHAVNQINRNIDLFRYAIFGGNLLALELINRKQQDGNAEDETQGLEVVANQTKTNKYTTFKEHLDGAPQQLKDVYLALLEEISEIGDDVTDSIQKFYHAFKRIKNFACIEIRPMKGVVVVYLKVDPKTIDETHPVAKICRDVKNIGHFGTGDLEVVLHSVDEIELISNLIRTSYDAC